LDGLNDVLWVHLEHAYGSARDLPGLIRSLTAADAKTRSSALHELFGNIWHQGTVYEATAYAVPFLFELIDERALPELKELLILLALIARGRGYHQVHDPSRTAATETEKLHVEAAREAVRSRVPSAIRLLRDPDVTVRSCAAHLLAAFAEDVRSRDALEAALVTERVPEARACLGLALACVSQLVDDAFDEAASCPLPMRRLRHLARMTCAQTVELDDVFNVLLDVASSELDPRILDDLGVPE
jgi:hypothetical protein